MFNFFNSHDKQEARLLKYFQENATVEIPLPRILDLRPRIAHHTDVIMRLRRKGYWIECRTYWEGGTHKSAYTYLGKGVEYTPHKKERKYTLVDMENAFERGQNNPHKLFNDFYKGN